MSNAIFPTSPPNFTSLGMNDLRFALTLKVGCLNSWKSTHAASPSTNSGLHDGSPMAVEAFAKLNKQSNSAKTLMTRSQTARSVSNSANKRNLKALIAALRFSRASFSSRTLLCSDRTTHRDLAYIDSGLFWRSFRRVRTYLC